MTATWTQEQLKAMTRRERHEIVTRFARGIGSVRGVQSWGMTNRLDWKEPLDPEKDYFIHVEVYEPAYQNDLPDSFEGIELKVEKVNSRIILA